MSDFLNGLPRDSEVSGNQTHGFARPEPSTNLSYLLSVESSVSVAFASVIPTMQQLVAFIRALVTPSEMRWIAAHAVAAQMPRLMRFLKRWPHDYL